MYEQKFKIRLSSFFCLEHCFILIGYQITVRDLFYFLSINELSLVSHTYLFRITFTSWWEKRKHESKSNKSPHFPSLFTSPLAINHGNKNGLMWEPKSRDKSEASHSRRHMRCQISQKVKGFDPCSSMRETSSIWRWDIFMGKTKSL